MFVEYGEGKRIYTRNIKSIISKENRKKSSIYHERYRNKHKEKIKEYRKKYYKIKKKNIKGDVRRLMLEVGEYIRDIDRGEILQVENVWKDDDGLGIKFKEYAGSNTFSKDDLKRFKHSKNIIDLIEVGDIIEYVDGDGEYIKDFIIKKHTPESLISFIEYLKTYCKVIAILTHEMYEKNCYKVGED